MFSVLCDGVCERLRHSGRRVVGRSWNVCSLFRTILNISASFTVSKVDGPNSTGAMASWPSHLCISPRHYFRAASDVLECTCRKCNWVATCDPCSRRTGCLFEAVNRVLRNISLRYAGLYPAGNVVGVAFPKTRTLRRMRPPSPHDVSLVCLPRNVSAVEEGMELTSLWKIGAPQTTFIGGVQTSLHWFSVRP